MRTRFDVVDSRKPPIERLARSYGTCCPGVAHQSQVLPSLTTCARWRSVPGGVAPHNRELPFRQWAALVLNTGDPKLATRFSHGCTISSSRPPGERGATNSAWLRPCAQGALDVYRRLCHARMPVKPPSAVCLPVSCSWATLKAHRRHTYETKSRPATFAKRTSKTLFAHGGRNRSDTPTGTNQRLASLALVTWCCGAFRSQVHRMTWRLRSRTAMAVPLNQAFAAVFFGIPTSGFSRGLST